MNITKTNWFTKFVECMLVAIAFINVLGMTFELLPEKLLEKIGEQVFEIFMLAEYSLGLFFGIGYAIYWHKKEMAGTINSPKKHAWFIGIIRYWLALEICTYGFAKILGTQFQTAHYQQDVLLGNASGFTLTWYYFGYSYINACIIAAAQIGGAILLLFRRTVLLGSIMLLPVMINIMLINIFYNIAIGAFANSVVFTIGLLFLISRYWQQLKAVFLQLQSNLPVIKLGWFKYVVKALPVVLSFLLIESFLWGDKSDKKLIGTWQVKTMIKNGDTLDNKRWFTDSLCYSLALSPNPYTYIWKEARRGSYAYNETTHEVKAELTGLAPTKDSLLATITVFTKDSMLLKGTYLKDTIVMVLKREKK
jgi:hypothetical protein